MSQSNPTQTACIREYSVVITSLLGTYNVWYRQICVFSSLGVVVVVFAPCFPKDVFLRDTLTG